MKHEVIMDTWIGMDSWSGREDAGMSLHLSEEDYRAFLKEFYVGRPAQAPEYYEQEDGSPRKVLVDTELYKKIRESKNGIRHYGKINSKTTTEIT